MQTKTFDMMSKELDINSVMSEFKSSIPDINSMMNDLNSSDIPPEVKKELESSISTFGFNELTSGWSIL